MKYTGVVEAILFYNKKYNVLLNVGTDKIKCKLDKEGLKKIRRYKKYELEGEYEKDIFKVSNVEYFYSMKVEVKILSNTIGAENFNNAMKYFSLDCNKKEALERLESALASQNKEILKKAGIKDVDFVLKKFQANLRLISTYKELEVFDFDYNQFKKIYKKFRREENVFEEIKKNPYELLYKANLSFSKCDLLFSYFGGHASDKKRVAMAIWFSLKEELSKGNTYTPLEMLQQKSGEFLSKIPFGQEENVLVDINERMGAILEMVETGKIVKDEEDNFYLSKVYNYERKVSIFFNKRVTHNKPVTTLEDKIAEYETEVQGFKLGREQAEAVRVSMANDISVITGGAGTGKTSSLACIIYILQNVYGYEAKDICLVAPTGKASKRMSESINKTLKTDEFCAQTIHRELKLRPSDDLDMGAEEKVISDNIAIRTAKAVIVDETSMVDLHIAYELISSVSEDAKLIFLGDIEQLPPVGYGYFLRDIIEFGTPATELKEVHRQKGDSGIVDIALKVRNEVIEMSDLKNTSDFGFYDFAQRNIVTFEEKLDIIVDLFERGVKDSNLDETMVLSPLNDKRKALSSLEINNAIQARIMPEKPGEVTVKMNGYSFKVGSKVILTKNLNEKGLVNGQIGYIKEIVTSDKFVIDFEEGEGTLEEEELENLRLAYCITVHKSQGSEWKNCIYVCDSECKMNTKNLVYTAITRPKQKLIVVGSKETFVKSKNFKQNGRRSRILKF